MQCVCNDLPIDIDITVYINKYPKLSQCSCSSYTGTKNQLICRVSHHSLSRSAALIYSLHVWSKTDYICNSSTSATWSPNKVNNRNFFNHRVNLIIHIFVYRMWYQDTLLIATFSEKHLTFESTSLFILSFSFDVFDVSSLVVFGSIIDNFAIFLRYYDIIKSQTVSNLQSLRKLSSRQTVWKFSFIGWGPNFFAGGSFLHSRHKTAYNEDYPHIFHDLNWPTLSITQASCVWVNVAVTNFKFLAGKKSTFDRMIF